MHLDVHDPHVVLANRLLGGDPPDVWQTHPGASIEQYIDAGQIADVSSIYQRDNLTSVIRQDLRQAVSKDGNQYGVSTGVHRINMLWFNRRLLDKATVTVPAGGYTADALLNDLAKLKAAGVVPLCLGAKDPFVRAELFENTLLGVIGADGWSSLTSDRLNWNGPQVRQALGRFATMLNYADPEAGALTWDQATRNLAAGKCAFESMNDSAYGELVVDGQGRNRLRLRTLPRHRQPIHDRCRHLRNGEERQGPAERKGIPGNDRNRPHSAGVQ